MVVVLFLIQSVDLVQHSNQPAYPMDCQFVLVDKYKLPYDLEPYIQYVDHKYNKDLVKKYY